MALALALALAAGPAPAAAERRGIVSINLCADQYLLALADRRQIRALSPFAADPAISAYAARAAGLPRIADDAETMLRHAPAAVIASIWSRPATLALIRRLGIPLLVLTEPATPAAVAREIAAVAAFIGRPAAGRAATARLARALRRTRQRHGGASALLMERGGYPARPGGLADALLRHAGLRNVAGGGSGAWSVEAVLAARPARLILASLAPNGDLGAALIAHPALARAYPADRRMTLPARLTICGGPHTAAALAALR